MNAEAVVSLLEQNWNRLRDELGDQWMDFTCSYREIVRQLPAQSARENLERSVDEVCNLLSSYEFGRGLLRGSLVRTFDQKRMGKSEDEVMDDHEQLQQVCNRLTELIEQEQQEDRKQKDDERGLAKDGGQR